MVKGLGRLIKAKEEVVTITTKRFLIVKFNILTKLQYIVVKIIGDEVMKPVVDGEFGRDIKKNNSEKIFMLTQLMCQNDSFVGRNMHFAYYCTCKFFIRACNELYNVNVEDFSMITNAFEKVFR